jgi:hypothetical protein
MFMIRRIARDQRAHLRAIAKLYRRFSEENTSEARGLRLLRSWLSEQQREQFDTKGYFDVVGCHSGTRYRIRYGTAMNVHELDEADNFRIGWCFVPDGSLVAGDVMLAQKIALETSERSALKVAKRFLSR